MIKSFLFSQLIMACYAAAGPKTTVNLISQDQSVNNTVGTSLDFTYWLDCKNGGSIKNTSATLYF